MTGATRVVLSCEGIFNHWSDYSAGAKLELTALSATFDVTMWIFFREPVSWVLSSYIQSVKNAPYHLAPRYATAEPLETVLDQDYYKTRLQYAHFVREAEQVFGSATVRPMRYESGDILEQARAFLGVDASVLGAVADQNRALTAIGWNSCCVSTACSLWPRSVNASRR